MAANLLRYLPVIVFVHFLEKFLYLRFLPEKLFEGEKSVEVSISGAKEIFHLFPEIYWNDPFIFMKRSILLTLRKFQRKVLCHLDLIIWTWWNVYHLSFCVIFLQWYFGTVVLPVKPVIFVLTHFEVGTPEAFRILCHSSWLNFPSLFLSARSKYRRIWKCFNQLESYFVLWWFLFNYLAFHKTSRKQHLNPRTS